MESPHAVFSHCTNWLPYPRRLQNMWTFDDFFGNPWPVMFRTKREAYAMGLRHKDAVLDRAMEQIRKDRGQ